MAGKNQLKYSDSIRFTPIDDLNERAPDKYSEDERTLRKKIGCRLQIG
jgi:hypothetical protein